MEENKIIHCTHCHTILAGPICHACGQKLRRERWSATGMLKQFLHQLTNIEKGFLHTAIILFSDPETIIHNFWNRNIVKYYNPFRYLLIWTAINLAINFWIGLDDLLQEYLQPKIVEPKLCVSIIYLPGRRR